MKVYLSGTGLYTPPETISNEELVASYNQYVQAHPEEALQESSAEFILKASGIKSRHVINKSGILNPEIMHPLIPVRANDEPSLQCEWAVDAAKQAMETAKKTSADIDMVLVACSNLQRPYPAIAVEVQTALGIQGYAFDMNIACSSATFGIQTAVNAIQTGQARAVLMVNPEMGSAQVNFRDRDSHFIFGDACTAVIIDSVKTVHSFEILNIVLRTQFSNNIRNNFGFLNRILPPHANLGATLFSQQGRQVFKEVVPLVAQIITQQLADNHLKPSDIKRLWLHQANINMNQLIASKILGHEATPKEAPIILDEYANTGSPGSIIAFHKYHNDLVSGDLGILSSFGAGYSVGSIILKK